MNRLPIYCASCGQRWTVAHTFSLYEQQRVESCPCPRCGAYTLCCQPPRDIPAIEKRSPVRDWRPVVLRG